MKVTVTAGTVPKRNLTARVRRFRGTLVVAGLEDAFELTDSAEFIFRAVDGVRTIAQIGELVAAEYGVSLAEAVVDVSELINELVEHQIMDTGGTGDVA